jgi:hypothetical protein
MTTSALSEPESVSSFDLTWYVGEERRGRKRMRILFFGAAAGLFGFPAFVTIYQAILGFPVRSLVDYGVLYALFGLPGVYLVARGLPLGESGLPRTLRVSPRGFALDFPGQPSQTWLWSDRATSIILKDLTPATLWPGSKMGRYRLYYSSLGLGYDIPIPEEAHMILENSARAAGTKVWERTAVGGKGSITPMGARLLIIQGR